MWGLMPDNDEKSPIVESESKSARAAATYWLLAAVSAKVTLVPASESPLLANQLVIACSSIG